MNRFAQLLLCLIAVALLTSCEEDIAKRQAVFTATMPADDLSSLRPGSIINGVPAADGFNLNAQWKDGDKIQIFVRQDGKVYQAESTSTVSDISSDGKTCSFELVLPKSVKTDRDYDIIGVTGVEAYIDGDDVIASCALTRVGIDDSGSVSLPMWFTCKKGSNQAKFRHLCAYEVLYVNNNSDSSIRFKHGGFEVMTPWYKYIDKVVLGGNVFSGYEAGQTDAESNEITIDAWETGMIVSWYIPANDITNESTGAAIDNAKLKAVVNGSATKSADALKANKSFARGSAYYMQAIWDGSTLNFSNEFCPDGNHPHAIDMGLPSGRKIACCNIGANSPSECGDYFAWGETSPKPYYAMSNYKWFSGGDDHKITKYCSNSEYGVVDNIVGLELEDDAAYVNWGPEWRVPGTATINELLENCTTKWTKVNGMFGLVFKSNTSNGAVFFPAAGWYVKDNLKGLEEAGIYWSRHNPYTSAANWAFNMSFGIGDFGEMDWLSLTGLNRYCGCTIRPVHVPQE